MDRRIRSLPRNVWVVTLTSFLTDVSSEMLVWLLPLFLGDVLGARTAAIGLIEGVAETTASVLKVFSGWLSDRLGQRKRLAVAGYAISTVSKPLLLFVTSWGGVLLARTGDRLGKGLRTAPRDALLADSVDRSRHGLAFGLHRAGDSAGAMVGVLVALLVVMFGQHSGDRLSLLGFRGLVLLSVVPAVLAVLVLAIWARDIPIADDRRTPPRLSLAPFDSRFRMFVAIIVLFTLGNSSDAFLVLRAQRAGLPLAGVLGMALSFNLVYSLLSGPAGAISDRVGRKALLAAGWIIYALIYVGFALLSEGWQAWFLMTAYGIYAACFEGVAKAYVADLVPAELRATAYGVFSTATGLAAFPASLLAGILWEGIGNWSGWGPRAPFAFGAILAITAAILLLTLMPRSDQTDADAE